MLISDFTLWSIRRIHFEWILPSKKHDGIYIQDSRASFLSLWIKRWICFVVSVCRFTVVSRALCVTCRATPFPTPPFLWRVLTMTWPQVSVKTHTIPKHTLPLHHTSIRRHKVKSVMVRCCTWCRCCHLVEILGTALLFQQLISVTWTCCSLIVNMQVLMR